MYYENYKNIFADDSLIQEVERDFGNKHLGEQLSRIAVITMPEIRAKAIAEWDALVQKEKVFFEKHGYIEVQFDPLKQEYSRKKSKGRPSAQDTRSEKISIRLSEDEINKLKIYCRTNNIEKISDAIRIALEQLITE